MNTTFYTSGATSGASRQSVPHKITLRPDLQAIAELVPNSVKVLDLGSGDGTLLAHLAQQKQVKGRGIELSEEGVLSSVRLGLSVRQGNLQEGLADYPKNSFDVVILSQTLPFLDDPSMILKEMLRVGQKAIVSFSNWGYWRCRFNLLLNGTMPKAPDLPDLWHDIPRWQAFTVADFSDFCPKIGIRISQQVYLDGTRRLKTRRFKNLRSTTAIFGLEKIR